MAMFIRVDLNPDVIRKTDGLVKKLIDVCPVAIFAQGSDPTSVTVVEDNVDECTLCDRCMQASPDGVKIVKLYE